MAETVDQLTVNYEDNGSQVVEELDKEILTKGAWATVLFRYRERDRSSGDWGAEKYTIRRYQKRSGRYQMAGKFNISSADQARKIIATLQRWTDSGE